MVHTSFKTLHEWLHHLEHAHPLGLIDLGLERVDKVRQRMNLTPQCPVVEVAGTNGKGSVCAYVTQIYVEAGYCVGTLTSPHLLHFNERIALNGKPVSDELIMESFARIEHARSEVSLTYFEFNTLAAVDIFSRAQVDVMILEVGLGGRLDAVNIFDADVAVITSVDLDHQSFLGDTIEKIAFEKAGIMRSGKPVICGQMPVPDSLRQHAEQIGADLLVIGRDFDYQTIEQQQWSYRCHCQKQPPLLTAHARHALPMPALRGAFQLPNAACALTVLECLYRQLPIDIGAIKRGLVRVCNPGRFQVLPGRPVTVLDVGHNPHAARALRKGLISLPYAQKRLAVFSILADKDIDGVLDIVSDQFDTWLVAPLPVPRGMKLADLQQKLQAHGIKNIYTFHHIQEAYQATLSQAGEDDRIVVFGSFHTVAEVLAFLSK